MKSFLQNWALSGLFGAFPGCVGAFSGPIGTNSSAPHGHGEERKLPRAKPPFAKPPFGFPRTQLVDVKIKFVNCCCQGHPSKEMFFHEHCNACVRVSDHVVLWMFVKVQLLHSCPDSFSQRLGKQSQWTLEGPTRKPRHASVLRTSRPYLTAGNGHPRVKFWCFVIWPFWGNFCRSEFHFCRFSWSGPAQVLEKSHFAPGGAFGLKSSMDWLCFWKNSW